MANPRIYREITEKRGILRGIYGGMMTLNEVMTELGYTSPVSARRAVQEMGIVPTQVGRMKRYETDLVAKRIVELRGMC